MYQEKLSSKNKFLWNEEISHLLDPFGELDKGYYS